MSMKIQRLAAVVLAAALAATPSAFAETRSRSRTDLERTREALAKLFGEEEVKPAPSSPRLQAIVDAMNRERVSRGLEPLRLDAQLSAAAEDRARDMMSKHYFSHVSPDGTDPFTWVSREGYEWSTIGENLATGYRGASSVVDGWMHSDGHRRNILGASFRDVGIAIIDASPVRGYGGPLVVALYGAR